MEDLGDRIWIDSTILNGLGIPKRDRNFAGRAILELRKDRSRVAAGYEIHNSLWDEYSPNGFAGLTVIFHLRRPFKTEKDFRSYLKKLSWKVRAEEITKEISYEYVNSEPSYYEYAIKRGGVKIEFSNPVI